MPHGEDAQGKSSNTGKSEQLPGCKCVFKQDSHKALGMTGKSRHKFVEIKGVKQLTTVLTMGKALFPGLQTAGKKQRKKNTAH